MSEPDYTTPDEMRAWLRETFDGDPEKSLLARLARALRDPACLGPEESRPHPLWLTLAFLLLVAVCVFVGFTLLRC